LLGKSSASPHAAGAPPLLISLPRDDLSPAQAHTRHDPLLQQGVHRQAPDVQSPCDLWHGGAAAARWRLAWMRGVTELIGQLGLVQDGKPCAAVANVLPQAQDRDVFASRGIAAARLTFALPFRRTGVMDRRAADQPPKEQRPE